MTLYPKVEDKFKFKDGWYIRDYEKITQPIFFLNENNGTVKFKGIKKILEEQNMWTGQRLDCRRKEDDEKDFLEQKTLIAETVEAAGHIFKLYPKFYCECNFIERFWGAAKQIACQQRFSQKAWRYIEAYATGLEGEDTERT
ncbi:43413_t:CDS:2, partial [Gigaspora margarita]